MTLAKATYDPSPAAFSIEGVTAGDAAEMETRLRELLASSSEPGAVVDLYLAGAGEGPGWEATLLLANNSPSLIVPRSLDFVGVAAAVAANGAEARLRFLERVAEQVADHPGAGLAALIKLELAGGGDGESMMMLGLLAFEPM